MIRPSDFRYLFLGISVGTGFISMFTKEHTETFVAIWAAFVFIGLSLEARNEATRKPTNKN